MRCYNPIKIKSENKFVKRGHVMVSEPTYLTVPCGKCLACIGQKSNELAMRCEHENIFYGYGENSCFVTLTYDKHHLPDDYSLHLEDLQKFLKRLRITINRKISKSKRIKYLAVGEYGSQRGRPHYHLIIFGLPCSSKVEKLITDCWKQGFVYVGTCTGESIKYVCKYMNKAKALYYNKKDYKKKTGREKPFRTMSKGIGKEWLKKYYKHVIKNDFKISYNGNMYSCPRSYIRWLYKLQLCDTVGEDLKRLAQERFIKELKRLYHKYKVPEETLLKYSCMPDDFKFSLEYYDDFYSLWKKEQEDTRYSYEVKHREYLTNLTYSSKIKPFGVA